MLNGKVICLQTAHKLFMVENKVYEFKNGRTTREDGYASAYYKDFHDLCKRHPNAKFTIANPKSLLKSGDKVTYRGGTERWVLLETDSLHSRRGYQENRISRYNDELKCNSLPETDIMKIERGTDLIWERAEVQVIKMTLDEVSKKLGLGGNVALEIIKE